ncbi:MAG: ATP-dependent helicase C-terminal domain-containing protein [Candidatus Binatia bacterium]
MRPLPIDPLLPDVIATLTRASRLVLRAPPGAGKTTRVPAALLDVGLAAGKEVLVLEPRRIAARSAAQFVARERGGTVGGEVGYRVRFEQRGGPATRLWFVTEGVLGRQLARDPFLEHAGVVVLDEFHERHLPGDVALAVVRELQETLRPDLKLVVMSATLDTERLSSYLGDCPVLTSEGRAYPVEIEYEKGTDDRPLSARVAVALQRLLTAADDGGDILVFLPGSGEIRRAATAIEPLARARGLDMVLLHGDLPLEAQQRAIRRGPRRKVVLSTNVAETALTIEGVTAVIDSGLARFAWFDARHGINAIRVMPISRASADQRAGRAGRTAPGCCLRLWTRADHDGRRALETPEVMRLDLTATVLELRAWGLGDPRRLGWLDSPGDAAVWRAERLLVQLGALGDDNGRLTDTGRRMLALSAPPRLARMLIEAERRGCADAGALLAALASERDICREHRAFGTACETLWAAGASDLLLRSELFQQAARADFDAATCRRLDLDPPAVRTVQRTRRHLLHALGPNGPAHQAGARGMAAVGLTSPSHPPRQGGDISAEDEALRRCVLAGFPDRVVRRRERGAPRGVMVGGTGVVLMPSSVVREAALFVAVEIEAGRQAQLSEAKVWVASAVEPVWLEGMFPEAMHHVRELLYDADRQRVVERRQVRFHDLVLDESVRVDVDPIRAGEVLAAAVQLDPAGAAQPGAAEQHFLDRLRFLQRAMPELDLPADPDAVMAASVVTLCRGRCSLQELRAADLMSALRRALTAPQRRALEREAPEQYRLPTGRVVPVRYERGKPPAVSARIQELFGLTATPRLARGRVPLVIELLGPNHRPVQRTDDLESFWRRTYPEVRKQLRGRYPKHHWPEDPVTATPTARTTRTSTR